MEQTVHAMSGDPLPNEKEPGKVSSSSGGHLNSVEVGNPRVKSKKRSRRSKGRAMVYENKGVDMSSQPDSPTTNLGQACSRRSESSPLIDTNRDPEAYSIFHPNPSFSTRRLVEISPSPRKQGSPKFLVPYDPRRRSEPEPPQCARSCVESGGSQSGALSLDDPSPFKEEDIDERIPCVYRNASRPISECFTEECFPVNVDVRPLKRFRAVSPHTFCGEQFRGGVSSPKIPCKPPMSYSGERNHPDPEAFYDPDHSTSPENGHPDRMPRRPISNPREQNPRHEDFHATGPPPSQHKFYPDERPPSPPSNRSYSPSSSYGDPRKLNVSHPGNRSTSPMWLGTRSRSRESVLSSSPFNRCPDSCSSSTCVPFGRNQLFKEPPAQNRPLPQACPGYLREEEIQGCSRPLWLPFSRTPASPPMSECYFEERPPSPDYPPGDPHRFRGSTFRLPSSSPMKRHIEPFFELNSNHSPPRPHNPRPKKIRSRKKAVRASIFLPGYPDIKLTSREGEMVRQSLIKKALSLKPDDFHPHISTHYFEKGVFTVHCDDNETRDWVIKTAPELQPWAGATLRACNTPKLMGKATLHMNLPRWYNGLKERDLLKALKGANKTRRELDFDHWKILSAQANASGGRSFVVSAPQTAASALKIDEKVWLGLNSISIAILKDRGPVGNSDNEDEVP